MSGRGEVVAESAFDRMMRVQRERDSLWDGVFRIAGDFHPDSPTQAPLALSEMRDALLALLHAGPQS